MIKNLVKGFTLAEVLITLGIIGIVAAMTLPTVVNSARNKQLEAGLKKSYSVLSQALDMYYAENWVKLTPKNVGARELKPILMKYLHTVKDCGWGAGDVSTACLSGIESQLRNYPPYKSLNGTDMSRNKFDDGQFVINDSSLVLLENSGSVLFISVDVNGYNKRPNRLGVDLFMFQIDNDGTLLPMGVKGTTYYNQNDEYCSWTATSGMNGAGCTYKALNEKDYFKNLPH